MELQGLTEKILLGIKDSSLYRYIQSHPWLTLGAAVTGYLLWDWLSPRLLNRKLPPGPLGLPLIGNFHQMTSDRYADYLKWREKYGEVFMVRSWNRKLVIVNGLDPIKEFLVRRGNEFANRPTATGGMAALNLEDEIFNPNHSPEFLAHKKFAVRALHSFGAGSGSLEEKIQDEVDKLCQHLLEHGGTSCNHLKRYIFKCLANIIYSIMFNKTNVNLEDPEGDVMVSRSSDMMATFFWALDNDIYPAWYTKLVDRKGFSKYMVYLRSIRQEMKDHIKEHHANFDPDNIRDVLDVYLNERMRVGDMTEGALIDTCMFFVPDAVHTTGSLMHLVLFYVVAHQHVQKRIQAEIDSVAGQGRTPCWSDRSRLTYLQATIMEVSRVTCMIPYGVHHEAVKDTQLLGYHIPTDASIFPNFNSVHHDPAIFPDPTTFNPENYLTSDGRLRNNDAFLTFSAGARMCIGEKLVKQECFQILASLLHKFTLTLDPQDGGNVKDKGMGEINFSIGDFSVIATVR